MTQKNFFKKLSWEFYLLFGFFLLIFALLLFVNYSFKLLNVDIQFGDNLVENLEIKKQVEDEVNKNSKTLLDFIFLDNTLITKLVRDEFGIVDRVDFNKKIYFNSFRDFGIKLYGVVIKNDKYFYACVQEKDRENFLVWSMQGNSNGEFYEEINSEMCDKTDTGQSLGMRFVLHPKSIYERVGEEKIEGIDSLTGMRIYKMKDFQVLKELITYLQKNSFEVKNIFVNELKLAEINLGDYILKVNLEKKVEDTVADFETISRAGKLEKYINGDKKQIEYIDLTYKDKVFFKLKDGLSSNFENDTKNGRMSTSSPVNSILQN
jgi:hypothetical protein